MPGRHRVKGLLIVLALFALLGVAGIWSVNAEGEERVKAIIPPATPLPSEEESRGQTRFSFILDGDTRGRATVSVCAIPPLSPP